MPTKVYQFKISLQDIKPAIWRRIQIPQNASFFDLHVAIQDAMGWEDCHLYEFRFGNLRSNDFISIGVEDGYREELLSSKKTKINKYFSEDSKQCTYIYDFGDDWMHKILFEKELTADSSLKYPACIAGKRACPPEDCGGPFGYSDLLEALNDPEHEDHEGMLDWLGGDFDPEEFKATSVKFR